MPLSRKPNAREERKKRAAWWLRRAPSAASTTAAPREERSSEMTVIAGEERTALPDVVVSDLAMPLVSCHYASGCVRAIGIAKSSFGWEMLPTSVRILPPDDRAPIAIHGDQGSETIAGALNVAGKSLSERLGTASFDVIAGQVVRRARLGEQNAMALIIACRENAEKGDERAKRACDAIARYIERNPHGAGFHGEPGEDTIVWESEWLANGPLVTHAVLSDIVAGMTPDEENAFRRGFTGQDVPARLDPNVARIGGALSRARAVQAARLGVLDFMPIAAWELGA